MRIAVYTFKKKGRKAMFEDNPNIIITNHPLIQHKITKLRD